MSLYVMTGEGWPLLLQPPDLDKSAVTRSATVDVDNFVSDAGDARQRTHSALPNINTSIEFVLDSRENINEMLEFLDLVAGRYAPFWLPTWNTDLEVLGGGFVAMVIRDIGYTERLFPNPAWRYLLGVAYTNPTDLRFGGVGGSVDNGDGTETLSTVLGGLSGLFEYRYMFRHPVRLDTDDIEINYINGNVATVTLPIIHLPELLT